MRVLVVTLAAVAFALGSGAVGGCSSASSSSASADGTACTAADGQTCPTGAGNLQICTTSSNGQCTGAYFLVGSQTFNCSSCSDTTACEGQAVATCYGDAGSGGGGSSGGSSGSSSGSGSQDASRD